MQNYQELMRDIEARMQTLGPRDVCALFLLSVESREAGRALDMTESAERAASLLSRFSASRTSSAIWARTASPLFSPATSPAASVWEKAATLSEALWFANEQTPAESIESYVGVYVFRAYDDVFKAIFRKADYALEMAHKDATAAFTSTPCRARSRPFSAPPSESFSSQMLRSYIDEGVRLIEVGEGQKAVYISPGYYRRLSSPATPPRRGRYASTPPIARPTSATCARPPRRAIPWRAATRVSRDGAAWIPCRLRLLRISETEKGAVVLEISHNISGLEELKNQYDEKARMAALPRR